MKERRKADGHWGGTWPADELKDEGDRWSDATRTGSTTRSGLDGIESGERRSSRTWRDVGDGLEVGSGGEVGGSGRERR